MDQKGTILLNEMGIKMEKDKSDGRVLIIKGFSWCFILSCTELTLKHYNDICLSTKHLHFNSIANQIHLLFKALF